MARLTGTFEMQACFFLFFYFFFFHCSSFKLINSNNGKQLGQENIRVCIFKASEKEARQRGPGPVCRRRASWLLGREERYTYF